MSTTAPMAAGAIARLTRDVGRYRAGTEVTIDDYVTAEQADDGKAFYFASTEGGVGNVDVEPDGLEQVMSAADAAARKVPAPREVAAMLDLCRDHDGLNCDATDLDGERVEMTCTTEDGLRVVVTVAVLSVYKADL